MLLNTILSSWAAKPRGFRIAVIFSISFLLCIFAYRYSTDDIGDYWRTRGGGGRGGGPDGAHATIPNRVHYVFVLRNDSIPLAFEFKHYLSIYASSLLWNPEEIFLHTNAPQSAIDDARSGARGKWGQLLFRIPNLTINRVTAPEKAGNGKEIKDMEHRSDFVRVESVLRYGGIYLDFDAYPLRDVRPLRESGFRGICGRQPDLDNDINSGVFMAARGGRMIDMWHTRMHEVFDGGWETHSNHALRTVAERLAREPREVLIMGSEAFAPDGFDPPDNINLFGLHNTTSAIEGLRQGDRLPSFDEALADRWNHPDRFPDWERDYSYSYIMHAFSPARNNDPVEGFKHITPRYVLERQSNFARLMYPVAKHMYDTGLIGFDDSYAAA